MGFDAERHEAAIDLKRGVQDCIDRMIDAQREKDFATLDIIDAEVERIEHQRNTAIRARIEANEQGRIGDAERADQRAKCLKDVLSRLTRMKAKLYRIGVRRRRQRQTQVGGAKHDAATIS